MSNVKKTNNLVIGNDILDLVDDEARELIDTLRSDVESDLADIRSDVSEDIADIDARVDNLVTDVSGAETVTLWNGSMSADGGTYTLSESVSGFDFIDIYYDNANTGVADYLRIPASKASASVYIPYFEVIGSGDKPLEIGKVSLTFSGTSVTVAAAKEYYWSGNSSDNAAYVNMQISFPVRIDGVRSSASVNAELADVRVGADGVTYASAGAAVRGQIESVHDDIYALESKVCPDFGYTVTANLSYTSKDVPNHDGSFFHDSSAVQHWFGSGYVKIPNGVKAIKYRGINYSASVVTPIAFYDVNKVFISAETKYTTYTIVEDTIAVPDNAKYFYQSEYYFEGDARNSNNYTIYEYGQKYDLDQMKQSTDALGSVAVKYGIEAYTSADIYLADGTKQTFSGWYSTDFIKCTGRNSIQYDAISYYDANHTPIIDVAYISFFDESKQFIGCLKSSDVTNGEQFGTTALPSGCAYVRGVTGGSIDPYIILNSTGFIKDIAAGNPLTNGMKICCVGDSLTKGVDVGSHVIKENYPYFMSQYLNCDIVNYGETGRSSKTWWDNYKDVHLFDPTMDIVLIMFGTNGGLATNTLSTDVDPYTDWHDYADTSVGDYCKLIEKIMEDTQNHAQIILLTPPYSTYTEAQEQLVKNSNAVVKAIAERYSIPVIDVLNDCGMGKFNASAFRPHDGCHFNAKGYHRLGTFIGSKVKSMVSTFSLDDNYDDETPEA